MYSDFVLNVADEDENYTAHNLMDLITAGSDSSSSGLSFSAGYYRQLSLDTSDGVSVDIDGSSFGFSIIIHFEDLATVNYVPYGNGTSSYNKGYSPVAGIATGTVSTSSIYGPSNRFFMYDDTDRIYDCDVTSYSASNVENANTGYYFLRSNIDMVTAEMYNLTITWQRTADMANWYLGAATPYYWVYSIGGTLTYDVSIDYLEIIAGDTSTMISNQEEIMTMMDSMQITLENIDETITDTSNQLQDSSSNIWQAAGETITNAIESLFVPSEEDISSVKQGFDDLAKDKLGGAYTAMETVDDTITQVNDKLNNPLAADGIEFPGISVPLGGDIGIVTLAEPQLVVLPAKLTAVLHPVSGTIVSIICGLGTFNVLKDMVECFLSGYSFAEYLHRNKGRSDE